MTDEEIRALVQEVVREEIQLLLGDLLLKADQYGAYGDPFQQALRGVFRDRNHNYHPGDRSCPECGMTGGHKMSCGHNLKR